jgi:hypothetical protein
LIIVGVCVSLFLVSSFRNSNQTNSDLVSQFTSFNYEEEMADIVGVPAEKNQDMLSSHKSVKYHNFLATYFLQESSVERTSKLRGEEKELFAGLKGFHNVIIAKTLSYF